MQNPNIVLYAPHTAKLEDRPIPTLSSPHDVVIRINYVGVCGSDVHFWHHASLGPPINPLTGITMGHEASGTIHSVGPGVTRVAPGDRVALEPGAPCRLCLACKSGSYNLCRKMRFAAAPGEETDTQGTLCKFYVLPEDLVYKVPEGLGLDEAVLVEPLAVGVHSVRLGDVRAGETVVVMGGGTVGLLCAAVAKQFGAMRVIVVDVVERKLEFARGYLGCETFLAKGEESAEESKERLFKTFGLGEESVDTVIEASGAAKSIESGILVLKPGGKFVQTGLGKAKVEFPIVVMSQKELMVRGCFRYGPGDYDLAIQLLEKRLVDVKPLISSVTPFEQATEAWEKTSRGEGIKNLIQGVV